MRNEAARTDAGDGRSDGKTEGAGAQKRGGKEGRDGSVGRYDSADLREQPRVRRIGIEALVPRNEQR